MLWFEQTFPERPVERIKVMIPDQREFGVSWDNSEDCGRKVFAHVARDYGIDLSLLTLDFFDNPVQEFGSGESVIFLKPDPETPEATGLYFPKDDSGRFTIAIDRENLSNPINFIGTIAHELAHVKLLGEERIEQNDEMLTDLLTVFMGYGIFTANSAFEFYTRTDRWGYQSRGYLKIEEWGYALAVLAYLRNEEAPDWSTHLNVRIRPEFKKSLRYMHAFPDELFRLDEGPGE